MGERELLRIAQRLGLLAQGRQLAQLLWAAGEAAQDLLALAAGLEAAQVIARRQELERARELAERVGVAADVDGVGGGAQVALGGEHGVAGELEVARDVGVVLAGTVRRRGRDALGDDAVEPRAILGGDHRVRDRHDHVVLEPVLALLGAEQAAADELVELGLHLPAHHRGDRGRRDDAAEDARGEQDLLLGFGQAIDARDQQILDRRRHLQRRVGLGPRVEPRVRGILGEDAALGERVEQLEDEVGVAAGARDDLLGELADLGAGHEARGDEAPARVEIELVERDHLRADRRPDIEDALVGARRDHAEDGAVGRHLEQRAEQLERLLIAPVHVLADDHQRAIRIEALLDAQHDLEHALPPLVGIDRRRGRAVAAGGRAHAQEEADDLGGALGLALVGVAACIHERHGARDAPLHLVRLGAVGEPEDLAGEVGDDAVRCERGGDARGGAQDVGLAGRDAGEERRHQRALADAVVADHAEEPLPARDEDVAVGVA